MKRLVFPAEWKTEEWYGFTRHCFEFEGCPAWIVEPHYTAGDGRWSWVVQWAEAFVQRVGVTALLEHGFYHVTIDVFKYRGSPEGIAVMGRFQDKLVSMGLSPKCNLIGMSWGGLLSLRYAETFPDRVCGIYLDAPVCDASEAEATNRLNDIMEAYGMTQAELAVSPLNPINNVAPIANIPVIGVVGLADETVNVNTNFDVFAQRFQEVGGQLEQIRRPAWGHHPHGLDDTTPLLDFQCRVREY